MCHFWQLLSANRHGCDKQLLQWQLKLTFCDELYLSSISSMCCGD